MIPAPPDGARLKAVPASEIETLIGLLEKARRRAEKKGITDAGSCLTASRFLVAFLAKATGQQWVMAAGTYHPNGLELGGSYHYWVESEKYRVDITADQFGGRSVFVEEINDPTSLYNRHSRYSAEGFRLS